MMSFQAHLEIQPYRPIPSVVQRSRYIDAVFPYGIVASYVHFAVIVFSYQVQAIQRIVPESFFRMLEMEFTPTVTPWSLSKSKPSNWMKEAYMPNVPHFWKVKCLVAAR